MDTPELRGGTLLTKAAAKFARDEARRFVDAADELLFHSKVWKGKYGRPIGDLIYRKFNISFLRDFGNESATVSPTCDKPRGFGHPRFSFAPREGRLLDSGAGESRSNRELDGRQDR